jgi:hypothetical protein
VALAGKAAVATMMRAYPAGSEQRKILHHGLDQILVDDPSTADFFAQLFNTD